MNPPAPSRLDRPASHCTDLAVRRGRARIRATFSRFRSHPGAARVTFAIQEFPYEPDGTRFPARRTRRTRIFGRRISRGAAWILRALRRDGGAHPHRGAALLERRSAGRLCVGGHRAAALPRNGIYAPVMLRRSFLLATVALAFTPGCAGAVSPRRLSFSGPLKQGGLVIGTAERGAQVSVDRVPVLVSPDGLFACGLEYDQKSSTLVMARFVDGATEVRDL